MKIEYVRQLQASYMRIELEESLSQTEREMITHNRMEGMLPVCWQKLDDKILLRYDITGKQSLDDLLEEKKVDERLLLGLLSGICKAVAELERYLLSQNALLLRAEAVFCDHNTGEMFFCFYPGQEDIQERLLRFMEYILTKTNHKDKSAVELAYGVYEELLKPGYCMKDVLDYMSTYRQQAYTVIEEVQEENTVGEEEKEDESLHRGKYRQTWKEWLQGRMTAWIDPLQEKWIRRKKLEPIVYEPEEEELPQGLPTELLAVRSSAIQGILHYEGTEELEDIIIGKVPFLIGSGKDCDGVVRAAGVSRRHARILLIEDTYFIEDLNSTNGTRVEGGFLSYKAKVGLHKNVVIQFANQPFRFQ